MTAFTVARRTCAALLLALTCIPSAVLAQEAPRVVPVHFAKGASSTSLKGTVKGYESVDYRLSAKSGQTLTVTLKASNTSTYFNLMAPGATTEAIYNSSLDAAGNSYKGELQHDGEYTVRVYQMRNAARRGNAATTLTLAVD
ncbi:g-type lysozyme inhibitor [Variovorax sp. HJSM1_2]|uniref:g-type lysozyme inhibitor n=1 Tax=Variovorax sp. HJSM1_2 TaxID=3366263 RepID=UPI003BD4C05F